MKKYFTYRHVYLLGTLLLCCSLNACSPKFININNSSATSAQIASPATNNNITPTDSLEVAQDVLKVKGKTITLKDTKDDIEKKLGMPNRVVDTEYDFEYYVYNNNYKRLVFIAIANERIVGFYTDSIDFNFSGILSGSSLQTVNQVLGTTFAMDDVLTQRTKEYTIDVLMDKLGTGQVTGIYILANSVKEDGFTDSINRNIELLNFDLTNSVRARNNVPVLSWSSSAAASSRKHSADMADYNFFNHIDPNGRTPGNRMNAEGISYTSCGENIIAGYGTSILSNHAWYNSEGHRKNMLNPNYRYLGVGFSYDAKSTYKTYITQNYYR